VAKDGSRRKAWDGLGTALLALMLAVVIWVNATYQSDSPREDWFQESIPIEILNKPSGLTITSQPEKFVNVRIKAFNSSWTTLKASNFRAVADLKGLDETGAPKPIPIDVTCSDRTVTIITTQPETVYIQLEKFQKKAVEVQPVLQDVNEVPLGYVVGLSEVEPQFVSVEGPASAVDRCGQAGGDSVVGWAARTH
jgi:YbbR domain-containing protein